MHPHTIHHIDLSQDTCAHIQYIHAQYRACSSRHTVMYTHTHTHTQTHSPSSVPNNVCYERQLLRPHPDSYSEVLWHNYQVVNIFKTTCTNPPTTGHLLATHNTFYNVIIFNKLQMFKC